MKKILLLFLAFASFTCVRAQVKYDSIYTANEGVLVVSVKEVTTDAVKFTYPEEDILNSMVKNKIHKIVFRSGRVQTFSQAVSFKKVTCADDWENVSVTKLESEVAGLYKIGDISVKAKNSTGFESSSKINDRAYRKLKMETALMGGNMVFIMQETSVGNKAGTQYQAGQAAETQISGIVYSSVLPKLQDVQQLIKDKRLLLIRKNEMKNNSVSFSTDEITSIPAVITNVEERDGVVYVSVPIKESSLTSFRVTHADNSKIILVEAAKGRITNYILIFV
jgi:hypothetical protein